MFESKLNILEQENESSYPNYAILIKQYFEAIQKISCKVEIPSKKHPAVFNSNSVEITHLRISVTHSRYDNYHSYSRCVISANMPFKNSYNVFLINTRGEKLEEKRSITGNY